jgi:uncharacterized protein YjbI with pentapeptide repeats
MSEAPRSPYPPDPGEERRGLPDRVDLEDLVDVVVSEQDWAGAQALRLSAARVELRRCRLTGAELGEATLRDVLFEECRLDLAGLRHARLQRVVFRECRMAECDLHGARLEDVLFEGCDLPEATFAAATIERVELRDCDLTGVAGAAALRGARMPWADILANAALFAAEAGIEIVDA